MKDSKKLRRGGYMSSGGPNGREGRLDCLPEGYASAVDALEVDLPREPLLVCALSAGRVWITRWGASPDRPLMSIVLSTEQARELAQGLSRAADVAGPGMNRASCGPSAGRAGQ